MNPNFMSKISEIFNGWGNYIRDEFDVLPPEIKVIAEARLNLCNVCVLRSGNRCSTQETAMNVKTGKLVSGCGCYLAAKTLSTDKDTECPMGKW